MEILIKIIELTVTLVALVMSMLCCIECWVATSPSSSSMKLPCSYEGCFQIYTDEYGKS